MELKIDGNTQAVYSEGSMIQHESPLTNSRLAWMPLFLREIETLSDELGLLDAIHQTLKQDNITVNVSGEFERLQEYQNGILFVGDHKNQWEFVALMDMLSRMNRDDMLNIAKFYVKRHIHQALGQTASKLVVPVYPRVLASDRGGFLRPQILNRLINHKYLLTTAESAKANTQAIDVVVSRLAKGGVVNIFPTGSVVDSMANTWRTGVGRIICELPEETRSDVLIVPYKMDPISRIRFVGAVAMRGHGFKGRPQTMHIRLAPIQTAAQLVDSLPDSDRDSPAAMTSHLQRQFMDHFTTE